MLTSKDFHEEPPLNRASTSFHFYNEYCWEQVASNRLSLSYFLLIFFVHYIFESSFQRNIYVFWSKQCDSECVVRGAWCLVREGSKPCSISRWENSRSCDSTTMILANWIFCMLVSFELVVVLLFTLLLRCIVYLFCACFELLVLHLSSRLDRSSLKWIIVRHIVICFLVPGYMAGRVSAVKLLKSLRNVLAETLLKQQERYGMTCWQLPLIFQDSYLPRNVHRQR